MKPLITPTVRAAPLSWGSPCKWRLVEPEILNDKTDECRRLGADPGTSRDETWTKPDNGTPLRALSSLERSRSSSLTILDT